MEANEYQTQAARTLIGSDSVQGSDYSGWEIRLVWNALGLTGEAGEVADHVKKAVFHEHDMDRDKLIKELGDVCWYVAALCSVLDLSLSDVLAANIAKLQIRYPDGWNTAASQARMDLHI